MKDVFTLIFSRDRAIQLDNVLRSLFLYCNDMDRANINVLYKASDERHASQYRKLACEYQGRVAFLRQKNFRADLFSMLNPHHGCEVGKFLYLLLNSIGSIGFSTGSVADRIWRRTFERTHRLIAKAMLSRTLRDQYILFLVDDNIFVRHFSLSDAINMLKKNRKMLGFSLRLGENTTWCYVHDKPQKLPVFDRLTDDIFQFDWSKSEHDFNYPLEVSSSIYRQEDILPITVGLSFDNPNILEERLSFHASIFGSSLPFLGCFQSSVTFCNPVNMVQSVIRNRSAEIFQYAIEALADRFDQGERICTEAYNGFTPSACHQEVELIFEKVEAR